MGSDTKSLLGSTTFWGAVLAILSPLALVFKVDLGDTATWVAALSAVGGGLIAIIGRVKAVKRIG